MKKGKRGFTLIEVSLFLAISGLLFFGIAIGVQNSVYQQRKNDSVQSFVEFLRGVYDEVLNVQNDADKGGRSESAIYGKLVTFGEDTNLAGGVANSSEIFTYTVIGDIKDIESRPILTMLNELKANIITENDGGVGSVLAGFASSYEPKWSAQIEQADFTPFKGMLLVVRHPSSGIVNTYFTKDVVQINQILAGGGSVAIFGESINYQIENVDFCVNSDPGNTNALRSDVRIIENARNASGIELLSDEEGVCNK